MKAIAAMSLNRVIGDQGRIPWHLPEDFKWFKQCTTGQVIVVGRKTFESFGKPLPNRLNVVLSRTMAEHSGIEVIRSIDDFDESKYAPREVWIAGGAEIYNRLLPKCSELYLSIVQKEVAGDTQFPEFEQWFEFNSVVKRFPEFEVCRYVRKG